MPAIVQRSFYHSFYRQLQGSKQSKQNIENQQCTDEKKKHLVYSSSQLSAAALNSVETENAVDIIHLPAIYLQAECNLIVVAVYTILYK